MGGLGSFACFGCAVRFERPANVPKRGRLKMRRVDYSHLSRDIFFKSKLS